MAKARKFHRERNQRRAFLKSLAVALIMKGKIKTTAARAKELRAFGERLVTSAKKSGYRQTSRILPKVAARKLVKELAPRYAERSGGYTRIIKLPPRRSDSARMAFIEFV